jgi:spermidine synthase
MTPAPDDPTPSINSNPGRTRLIIFSLFLFSGVSGLIYEVVWSRMLAHVLGTTTYAVATVLAVFMGGLALGSWLFGRVADRPNTNGLRLYAFLEILIGVFALALPLLLWLSDRVYQIAFPAVEDSFAGLVTLRVLLAAIVLIVPATLMGGTLPVLSKFLVKSKGRAGLDIGTLYAINTLGAVVGCFLAGFYLLELLGTRGSLNTAAALNFAVGIGAFVAAKRAPAQTGDIAPEVEPYTSPYAPWQIKLALVLYAISGMAALMLEVLWTRSLIYFTSVDLWAFTAMLTTFLFGLGLGSLLMARFAASIKRPMLALGLIQILVGLSAAASILLLGSLFGALEWVDGFVPSRGSLGGKIATKLFASFFVMLVPTLLMGAGFPLVSAIYVGAREKVGSGIGVLYALNTVGAIAGSLLAGFVLIPAMGIENAILFGSSFFVAIGLILVVASPIGRVPSPKAALITAALLAAVVWANTAFTGNPVVLKSRFFKAEGSGHTLVFEHEGVGASLVVLENPGGTRLLNINGITTAIRNYMDMQVHRMLSHLPMLIHPDPQTALVVGFGMGSTPWGVTQYPLEQVDVVELLRSEKKAAPYFSDINHNVLSNPKLNFIEGDGRNYLLGTRKRYDVISFNAIHPRFSANLYTKDFYELCRDRLSETGVICAWLTQNSMTEDEFRSLVRAFVEVFPNATLWFNNPEHYCLIGTIQPTQIDIDDWQRRMSEPGVNADLKDSNLDDPYVLLSRYMLGPDELAAYIEGAPLNTDNHPLVEFSRESKEQERIVVENIIAAMPEPGDITKAVEIINSGTAQGSAERLSAYFRGARLLLEGEIDYWYPVPENELTYLLPYRKAVAEIEYRRALTECPENQDIREQLRISDHSEAIAISARDARPTDAGPWTELSRIHMERGDFDEAQRFIDQATTLAAGHPLVLAQAGMLHLVAGHPARASPLLANSYQITQSPRTLYALGIAQKRMNQQARATELINQALAQDPLVKPWLESLEASIAALQGG